MADDNATFPVEFKMKAWLYTQYPPLDSQSFLLDSQRNVCRMHNYKEVNQTLCQNVTFTPKCVRLQ